MKPRILLISALALSCLSAQEKTADPVRHSDAAMAAEKADAPSNLSICYEAFSLPLAAAAKLQRERPSDPQLYKQVVEAVEKESARQESFAILRAKSGQKSLAESFREEIHPVEFSSPSLPCGSSSAASDPIPLPVVPTAFNTRNVGTTVEVEPTANEDGRTVEVRIVPETITEAARVTWGQGPATTEMPTFETQRTNTSITCQLNQPTLIGTLNRPPVSKVDNDSANRVWLAFLTVTRSEP